MPLDKTIIQQIRNNSITYLNLSHKRIGDAEVKYLAEALKDNQSITALYLENNQIGDAGAKGLAEGLKDNKSITTLSLQNNQIGEAGAKGLAEGLKDNKSITNLQLQSNQIGDAGAKGLAEALKDNKSITHLYLGSNQIGDAGAKGLAEGLKFNQSITTLDLKGNKIGDTGAMYIAEALKINPYITTIYLEENQIRDVVAKEIATKLQTNSNPTKKAVKILKQQQQAEAAKKARQDAARLKQLEEKLEAIVKAKQAKREAKEARQEAERLEQEAKLREQEEAKAIEEAAKLKAIEEAKVKEYVPEIQVVKLFEVADGDNQFDNADQDTIRQASNLIRDGNDRLQEHGKKGILLLGNTGAGKSTLAHLFSGRELQAIFDDETDELVIDAMQPLANIVIGHKLASETKIPNKCFAKDLIIWDCPGFNDTDPVQEIANGFYIKRLFETTEQLKFVLVIPELVLNSANERGSIFLTTLSNFIKSFKDIGAIESSISLVVTHVSPHKNIQHIKKSIEKILADNQGATDEHKALINKLKEDGSIHLFYKPSEAGELVVPNLLAAIDTSSKYSDAKGDMVNIAISKKAMECSSHLLNTASNNFNQLLEVIVKAIG